MPSINKLSVIITGDESGLKKATTEAQKDIDGVGKSALSIGKIAIGAAIGQMLTNVVSKAIGAVSRELDGAITRLDTINNYGKVMGNLGIGADDSAKSISYLQEHLLGLPTSLDSAALAVQRFAATNGDIKASTVGFLALNNAILAGGASMETQKTALEQIAQAYSKGRPDAMEWRAMLTAMPAQMNQIAQAAGFASAAIGGDMYEAIQNGKFSMNDFMATVVRLNTEGVNGFANFEEQARNATGGVQTSVANLRNAIQRGIATVLDTIGQANIAGFINGIAAAIGTVANYIAAFVRLIKEAVAWLGVLFGFKVGGGNTAKTAANATQQTANNLAAADKSAGGVAGGLNKAAGAAKKLNNQLASFDEMNVLRETTAGGSGGAGGGGGAVGAGSFAIPEIDWNLDSAKKNENAIEKILEKLKKAFDKFAKFLKPIAEVIADVWKSYLAPFFGWVGNDFLPAFLNAVGGALELVGSIIKSIYTVALKPFIDGFLVPIAEFTGGIIVAVLNGIGDALSWLAQQKDAINIITSIATAIGAVVAGLIAWNAAATFLNGFGLTMEGLPILLEKTKVGMLGIEAGTKAFFGAQNAASALGTVMNAVFSKATIVMGGLVAAALAVKTALEFITLKTMEAEAAEKLRITAVKKETEAMNWNADAIQRQIDLKNELKNIELELADSQLALLNAQEATANATSNLEAIAKKYGLTTEQATEYAKGLDVASGNLTEKDRELMRAVLELEQAQGRETEATNKVTETINKQTTATEELENQQWKEIATQKESEIAAMLAKGKYEEVEQALIDLTNSTGEYRLKNGEMVKFTKQDMESMADFIGDQMGQINTDSGRAWNEVWTTADFSVKKLKGTVKELADNGRIGGVDYAYGVKKGIESKQGELFSTTSWLGRQLNEHFKKVLDIHSPSRVMAEAGENVVLGIEEGMMSEESGLMKTAEGIGNALTSAFDASVQLPDLGATEAADKLDSLAEKAQAKMTVNSENTAGAIESLANAIVAMQEDKQPIVVKIGEETLVDTIVDGINNASEMRNRGVINI